MWEGNIKVDLRDTDFKTKRDGSVGPTAPVHIESLFYHLDFRV
jgi:hypothetical protein